MQFCVSGRKIEFLESFDLKNAYYALQNRQNAK